MIEPVYEERNRLAVAYARMARAAGWRVGWAVDVIEADWPVLMIDTPEGQVSWHMPAGFVVGSGVDDEFGIYDGEWDGHSTAEKYARLERVRPR